MPDQTFDLLVIGGGIVGLATALEVVRRSPGVRLAVLEKEDRVAAHQTGHNSGVIHSGLYYKPGSLKAKLCVEGARAMVEFCRTHRIPHQVCGKVVVATSEEEIPRLEELHRRGIANGLQGLEMIGPERLKEIEPHAAGIRALWVPSTGITDFAAVARKYAELIEAAGGKVMLGAEVVGIRHQGRVAIETRAGSFEGKTVINCAGLFSDRIALMAGSDPGVRIVPFRGEYYQLKESRRDLVRGLIYPVPNPALPFLGVHFTTRVDGMVEAGPNAVLALQREGYHKTDVSPRDLASAFSFGGFWRMAKRQWRTAVGEYYRSLSKGAFTRALQKLMPEIREEDLSQGGSGVRAQAIDANGKLVDDFQIVRTGNIVHVLNVPSPAATASLVIGKHISHELVSH